jgi:hypothetical protein
MGMVRQRGVDRSVTREAIHERIVRSFLSWVLVPRKLSLRCSCIDQLLGDLVRCDYIHVHSARREVDDDDDDSVDNEESIEESIEDETEEEEEVEQEVDDNDASQKKKLLEEKQTIYHGYTMNIRVNEVTHFYFSKHLNHEEKPHIGVPIEYDVEDRLKVVRFFQQTGDRKVQKRRTEDKLYTFKSIKLQSRNENSVFDQILQRCDELQLSVIPHLIRSIWNEEMKRHDESLFDSSLRMHDSPLSSRKSVRQCQSPSDHTSNFFTPA